MNEEKITIISDGTANGTKVQIGDKFLKGVTRIEMLPLEVGGTVTARITVDVVSLRMGLKKADIVCTDVATEEQIRQALLSAEC